ncbi:hypothetical protein GCM10028868_01890 [Virgibacillus kimchii]
MRVYTQSDEAEEEIGKSIVRPIYTAWHFTLNCHAVFIVETDRKFDSSKLYRRILPAFGFAAEIPTIGGIGNKIW